MVRRDDPRELDPKIMRTPAPPSWFYPLLFSALIALVGWVAKGSEISSKVYAQDEVNRGLSERVSFNTSLVSRHDAILPIMQNDISEIKQDIKRILTAVKP